jgi:hypothetical protein
MFKMKSSAFKVLLAFLAFSILLVDASPFNALPPFKRQNGIHQRGGVVKGTGTGATTTAAGKTAAAAGGTTTASVSDIPGFSTSLSLQLWLGLEDPAPPLIQLKLLSTNII